MSPRLAFSAFVVLLLSIVVSPVYAQQTLENPQPASFQSGIGVISGWACNAQTIEISFNGGPRIQAAIGTIREDTQGACGDTDNGFGLLYNWNRLGDGSHTVTAYADGVKFASVTVIVTTLGAEFLRGASGTLPLPDFPIPGTSRALRWQQAQQNFVITAGNPQGGGTSGAAPHVLENPQPGSFQSGVGVISGWACEVQTIEISFNGGPRLQAGTGTIREDTQGVCGDTDNGFGLLYNWNRLGDGSHTVTAYADGVEFAEVTVTVTTLGEEFRRGLSREVIIPDFPEVGIDTVLQWQEAQQNFVISFTAATQRLVAVTSMLTLPMGVNMPNVAITSLLSDTTPDVRASPQPTLLLAEDTGGVVLLGLANMDGGLLGEPLGEVDVSIDSTAVVLVALAVGVRLPDVEQALVDQIRAHPQYSALTAALSALLQTDPHFLDRLFDYPDVVAQIRTIGTSLSGSASADVPPQPAAPPTFADQSGSVLPDGVRHENFYCLPVLGCSPWREYAPWVWYGEAPGGLFHASPFLAASETEPGLTATGNPNFIDYALEIYTEDGFLDWYWVPGNDSLSDKVWNSNAAHRVIPLGPQVTRVAFERYRLDASSPRAAALSFLNTAQVILAAVELIGGIEVIAKVIDTLPVKQEYRELAKCAAPLITGEVAPSAIAGAGREEQEGRAWQFIKPRAVRALEAAVQCRAITDRIPRTLEWAVVEVALRKKLAKLLAGPASWVVLGFKLGNEVVPKFLSYGLPAAGSVDYHLGWTEEDDGISNMTCVSDEEPCGLEAPENLRVTDIQETSATLEWDEVERAEQYTVRIYAAEEVLRERMPRETAATVIGLEAGETYIFEVFATSIAGIDGEMATLQYEHNPPEPPEFEETFYTFTLLENRDDHRSGVTVGRVRAIDPEGLRNIEYSLARGSVTKFAVDRQTGVVRYIGRGEDYESGPREYSLTVRATEVGEDGLSTDVRVTVEIEDEDELPYFEEGGYDFTVQITGPGLNDNDPVFIGVVQAQDPEGEEVHHSLGSGAAAGFRVFPEGVVTYCCANTPLQGGAETHRLIVFAVESDGSGPRISTEVTVRLVGNRPPVFTAASYSFTLGENVAGPKALGTVVARDPDAGDTVTYSLSVGDGTRFTVDSTTGVVSYIGTGEDYEEQANFTLEVVATDAARLSTDVPVNVRLIEDHPYQLIYCRRDRDVEIEGSDHGWSGRSSWHCIDTELKHERPELFTPYQVCNEYNRTHAWLRGPDAMLMEVIGEYQDQAQCVEDIPVEMSCIGSHEGFCGYWGGWD